MPQTSQTAELIKLIQEHRPGCRALAPQVARALVRHAKALHHPSAYRRVGWSSLVYRASTRRVEVGERWLAALSALDFGEPFTF